MTVSAVAPILWLMDIEVDSVQKENGDPVPCITQLCVYQYDKSVPKAERVFEAFINPPAHLRRKAVEHNFAHGHVGPRKYTMEELWPHFKDHINKKLKPDQSAVFMVYNQDHDWPIFERELTRIGQSIPRMWKPYDIAWLTLALGLGDKSAFDNRPNFVKLTALCHKLGAKVLDAHSAYNDTIMLKRVFKKLVGNADLNAVGLAMLTPKTEHPHRAVKEVIRSTSTKVNDVAGAAFAYVVLDYETTGKDLPDPTKGKVCEWPRVVQMAAHIPELDITFETLVNPGMPIPPDSTKIHHITDAMVKGAPDIKTANQRLDAWLKEQLPKLGNRQVVLVGHNLIDYDERIRKHDREVTGLPYIEYKLLDTLRVARSLFAGIKADREGKTISKRLQRLRKGLGIAEDKAHDAGGDVRVTWRVLQALTSGLSPQDFNNAVRNFASAKSLATMIKDKGTFSPLQYLEPPPSDNEAEPSPKKARTQEPPKRVPAAAQQHDEADMQIEEDAAPQHVGPTAAAAASASKGDVMYDPFEDPDLAWAFEEHPQQSAPVDEKPKRKWRVEEIVLDDEASPPTLPEKKEKQPPPRSIPAPSSSAVVPQSPNLAVKKEKEKKAFGGDATHSRQVQLSDAFLRAKSLQRPEPVAPPVQKPPAAIQKPLAKAVLPTPPQSTSPKQIVPIAAHASSRKPTAPPSQPAANTSTASKRPFGLVDSSDDENSNGENEGHSVSFVPKPAPKAKPSGAALN